MKTNSFKRLIAFCLTFILILTTAIVAYAATPVSLSKSNIITYPSVEGSCYYGQKIGEALTLIGGEVQYNGNTVEGKFVFTDPEKIPNSIGSGARADFDFVPENTEEYVGFSVSRSRDVKYTVLAADLILADESNTPLATVDEGALLSEAVITNGQVKNKYNAEEPTALSATWSWSNPNTVITESGYHEAYIKLSNYNNFVLNIYVEVKLAEIPYAQITEKPTIIGELTYNPKSNATWSDIELSGGESNVAGTFAVSEEWKSKIIYPGTHSVDVVFTPDDLTQAQAVTIQIPVTVNAAPITFETEDGTGVPTITVDYGKKTNDDMGLMLKQYVPEDVQIQYIDFYGLDGQLLEHANKTYDPGSYTFTCRARTQNKNYATTMLTFNVVINKVKINPQIEGNGNRMIIRDVSGQYNPKGTFDLYINDELVKEDIPYNEYFTWEHTTSGDKNFKAVYNPGDDNRYEIDPITRADGEVKLDWPFASGDGHSTTYTYGETVKVEAPATDPAKPDKPYYGFAGWNVVEGDPGLTEEELASPTVSFEMPDGGVKLEPTYEFSLELFFQWIWQQIVDFFTFIFNAITELFALAA